VRDEIFFRQNTFHFPNVFNNKKKITLNQLPTNLVKGTTVFLDKNNLNKFAKLNLTQNLAKKTHYFYEISISQNINFKIEKKYDLNQILKAKYNSQHNHTSNISQNISQNYLIYEDFQNKDIDIEVYDIDENKFVNLMEKLGAKGVGRSFFVYKFGNFDISLPRTESKIYSGHKGFSVALTNDEQTASKRRDFTINSIMRNIFTGEILDFISRQNEPLFAKVENELLDTPPKISSEISKTTPQNEQEIPQIKIDDFKKSIIKVGTILECENIAGSEKLLKFKIDLGENAPRQIISGIAKFYTPSELVGKQVCVLANLKPAKIFGHISEGMILSAEDGKLTLLSTLSSVKNGAIVG